LTCRQQNRRFPFDFDRNASCSAVFQGPTLFKRQKTRKNEGLTPIEKQLQRSGLTPVCNAVAQGSLPCKASSLRRVVVD
jgi:hypothetical protein